MASNSVSAALKGLTVPTIRCGHREASRHCAIIVCKGRIVS